MCSIAPCVGELPLARHVLGRILVFANGLKQPAHVTSGQWRPPGVARQLSNQAKDKILVKG
jgi:hypothetical protein